MCTYKQVKEYLLAELEAFSSRFSRLNKVTYLNLYIFH